MKNAKKTKTYRSVAVKDTSGTVNLDVGSTNSHKIVVPVQIPLGKGNGTG